MHVTQDVKKPIYFALLVWSEEKALLAHLQWLAPS